MRPRRSNRPGSGRIGRCRPAAGRGGRTSGHASARALFGARADQDQVLLGAGHRDVEDAQLLGHRLPPQPLLHEHGRQRRVAGLLRVVHDRHAEAQLAVEQDRALAVAQVDRLAQVRQEHDRELQPLGAVDAHDPHDVLGLGRDRRLAEVRLLAELLEELHEPPEPLALERAELRGPLVEVDQVRDPLLAAGQARRRTRGSRSARRSTRSSPPAAGGGRRPASRAACGGSSRRNAASSSSRSAA